MASKIPGNIEVQGRFDLDAKYEVDSISNLNDGLIFNGLRRFTKDSQKSYIRRNGVWIPQEDSGGSITSTNYLSKVVTILGDQELILPSITSKIIYLAVSREGYPQLLERTSYSIVGNKVKILASENLKVNDILFGVSTDEINGTSSTLTPTPISGEFTDVDKEYVSNPSNWDIDSGQYIGPTLTTSVRAEFEVYATSTISGYWYSTNGQGKVNRYLSI